MVGNSESYKLVDLATKTGESLSPNAWKARLVLAYKGVPYKTQFVTFSDLQKTLAATGVPPHAKPNFAGSYYTVPHLTLPDGSMVMDSLEIAETLEKSHPEPSLRLDTGLHVEAQAAISTVFPPLLPVFLSYLHTNVVVKEDEALIEGRAAKLGVTAQDVHDPAVQARNETAWENAKPGFENVAKVLNEHKKDSGPFVLGSQVSYADFVIMGLARGFVQLGGGVGDRFMSNVKGLKELYVACEPWLRKAD